MRTTNLLRLRPATVENILIWIFALLYVFASQDPNLGDQNLSTILIAKLFMSDIVLPNLSIFELCVFLLSIYIIYKYRMSFWNARFKKERWIFFFTTIYIILSMLNPNSQVQNPILGMPLFSDPTLFIAAFFMFSIFFIKNDNDYLNLIGRIVSAVLLISIIRVFILHFLWLMGMGVSFYSVNSILMEEDTLLLNVLFGILFFIKYYQTKQKKYFLFWLLYLLLEIFSFRRSGMLLMILVSSSFYILMKTDVSSKVRKYLSLILIIVLLGVLSFNLNIIPPSAQLYLHRYIGQFVELPDSYKYERYAANLHVEQSNESITIYAKNLPFWGFGYGNTSMRSRTNFQGNTGIHNAYYKLWEERGLYALIYFLLIILYVLREALITLKYRRVLTPDLWNLRIAILAFIIFFFINAYVLMMINLIGLKMQIMWIIILSVLFKVNPGNYQTLFGYKPIYTNN